MLPSARPKLQLLALSANALTVHQRSQFESGVREHFLLVNIHLIYLKCLLSTVEFYSVPHLLT